ncbi:MAG: DegV family protein [Oscillospiraceae bacterium]|jgi:DegV family protein with EDD domain|nr:DegV family protein [Oscillospiraceae bacterium]
MVRIVTDSAADLTLEQAKELNVDIVRLKVMFGDTFFYQEEDSGNKNFYKMLAESKQLPTTSQPNPDDFLSIYKQAKEAGDSVVVITLSGELSGTLQSATIAKGMIDYDEIYIVDSRQVTSGQQLLVEYAVSLRSKGMGAKEIYEIISQSVAKVKIVAMVDTLEFLQKGGRISKGTAVIGSILNVKPIIIVDKGSGKLDVVDKGRGVKNSIGILCSLIADSGEIDTSVPVYYGYTNEQTNCDLFIDEAQERFGFPMYRTVSVGGVIGTHAGPGAVVLAFLLK